MAQRRTSCRHGPRPVSSNRSSSSSIEGIDEFDESLSVPSSPIRPLDLSRSFSTTSSLYSRYSTSSYDPCEAVAPLELKRNSHIRRSQRRKPRPLPPVPSTNRRPSLALEIPSSPPPPMRSRSRWLPVPPLPMTPFPEIAPTACSTPSSSLPPAVEYPYFEGEIDWCLIDEIMTQSQ